MTQAALTDRSTPYFDDAAAPAAGGHGGTPGRRRRWVRGLVNAGSLLGSGAVASLGFAALTSNRLSLVSPGLVVFIVLFVQWETLGLTIAKLGLDQIVFAALTEHPDARPVFGRHMRRRALPLAAGVAVAVTWMFGIVAGIGCFVAVLLDTHSSALLSALNARARFVDASIASLLNYPVFFVLLFAGAAAGAGPSLFVAFFVFSSVTRWAWLQSCERRYAGLRPLACDPGWSMGVQQLLNYVLFKSDQLILGITTIAVLVVGTADAVGVQRYLFLARYPELVSGVAVALAGMVLPRLFVRVSDDGVVAGGPGRDGRLLIGLSVAAAFAGAAVYALLWHGPRLPAAGVIPFAVTAALVLPANALTYSMLRQGYLEGLIRRLALGIGVGGALVIAAAAMHSWIVLAWAVASQLAVFFAAGLGSAWGRRGALYG